MGYGLVSERACDIDRFYGLLARLEKRVGGPHLLKNFPSVVSPGDRGVYFMFESGEYRADSDSLRVVRVGTHGLTARSRSTIWTRLFEHLMFNGRSVFRDHVNASLLNRAGILRADLDHRHAACITDYIGNMPFLWVRINSDDDHNVRHKIESNAIALLSNYHGPAIDKPSPEWIGRHRVNPKNFKRNHEKLTKSGLWNVNFVNKKKYDRSFLGDLKTAIDHTSTLRDVHQSESVCLPGYEDASK